MTRPPLRDLGPSAPVEPVHRQRAGIVLIVCHHHRLDRAGGDAMTWDGKTKCDHCQRVFVPADGGVINPKDGGHFHMRDCWPRVREQRTGQPFITCVECGEAEAGEWETKTADRLRERSLCFTCDFWTGYVSQRDNPAIARVNGEHYYIQPDTSSGFKGFGGSKFTVSFKDGREVVTHNLWGQGRIPDRFRDRLPDNAEFKP